MLKRQRNQLDQYKSLTKNEKGVQKKKLIDTQGESNLPLDHTSTPFLIFQIPPSGGGNQNLLPTPL